MNSFSCSYVRTIKTHQTTRFVGKIGQRKNWQGLDKTHQPDNPPDEGPQLGTQGHAGGVPHACIASGQYDAGIMPYVQVNTVQDIVCPLPAKISLK